MNACRQTAMRGPTVLHLVAWLAAIATLSGCAGYVPGAKAYWDAKVNDMCEKDGGVKIYDTVRISNTEIQLLPKIGGEIDIPNKSSAASTSPVYSEFTATDIRDKNPRVSRMESRIIRRADAKVVATWVMYSRSGADLRTGFSEPTSFLCPKPKLIRSELQRLFVIRGD